MKKYLFLFYTFICSNLFAQQEHINQMLIERQSINSKNELVYIAKMNNFDGSASYRQQIDSIVDSNIYITGTYSTQHKYSKGEFTEEVICPIPFEDTRDYTVIHRIVVNNGEPKLLEEKHLTFSKYRAGKHAVVYNVYIIPKKISENDKITLIRNLNVNCAYTEQVDSIVKNVIYMTGCYDLNTNCRPYPGIYEFNLGKLPAGEYTLKHKIWEKTGTDNIDTTYTRQFTVYNENDITPVRPITTNLHNKRSSIYDLSGRKLMQKPQKGFYIQGGKKFLLK